MKKLASIEGGSQPLPEWLRFPSVVLAKSPYDQDVTCRFRVSATDCHRGLLSNRRQPAFELWSAVMGLPPPVLGVGASKNYPPAAGLSSLRQAHACFEGLKRPIGNQDGGDGVVVYVTKPSCAYRYRPSPTGTAEKFSVPEDVVFLTCVKLDVPYEPNAMASGVVTHWLFSEADPNGPDLPVEFETRFARRLW